MAVTQIEEAKHLDGTEIGSMIKVHDLVPMMSCDLLSNVTSMHVDQAVLAEISDCPRLRHKVARLVCIEKNLPAEFEVPQTAAHRIVLQGTRSELKAVISLAAALLSLDDIRSSISADDIRTCRAAFGDRAIERALSANVSGLDAKISLAPDRENGWLAMAAWIARQDRTGRNCLKLRFKKRELEALANGEEYEADFSKAFQIASDIYLAEKNET